MIAFESPHVVAVDKPAGWLTIPGRHGEADPRPVLAHEIAKRYEGKIWIVHRLDVEVSGVVLFARSAVAHRVLCRWFEQRSVSKSYEAWTERAVPPDPDGERVWEGYLVRGKRRVWETTDATKGKWSRTRARPVGEVAWGGQTLVAWDLRPETGRPHQIRCQASGRGYPVAGDTLYGASRPFLSGTIALRAVGLEFGGVGAVEREALGLPERVEVRSGAALWRI